MLGWFVANGRASTPDCINRFLRSGIISGSVGGSNNAVVVEHSHDKTYRGIGTGAVPGLMTDTVYSSNSLTANIGGSSPEGVSGINANMPSFMDSIPIIRMS